LELNEIMEILSKPPKKTCPCCGHGAASVDRPMVLRKVFGNVCPVKICEFCNKTLTDFQVVQFVTPMSSWYRMERILYGRETDAGTKIIHSLTDGNFHSPVLINDLAVLKRFPQRIKRKRSKVKVTVCLGDGESGSGLALKSGENKGGVE